MSDDDRYEHYEIVKRTGGSLWELGPGDMSVTYKAYDTHLHRPVVLKVMNAACIENETARHRFLDEALKPVNLVLVDEEGEKVVKVTDFGLAKRAERESEESRTLPIEGSFLGTPDFASPEQLEQRGIDVRSNIYSLGATLYYLVTGHPPFSGSVGQIMSQHLRPVPT